MSECVNCTVDNHIAMVTINRPKELNAINEDVLRALYTTMKGLDEDQDVKVVILTGNGGKAFVAGADISSMNGMDPEAARRFSAIGHKTMNKISSMRPFVIAAVNGYALGGGCELALACDMRVASERARMGIPEVTLGIIPGFGGTQRLPRLVGLGVAKELMATGRQVNADEALRIGLVNRVTAATDLISTCVEIAEEIAENSTSAVSLGKQAMNSGVEISLDKALEMETNMFSYAFSTNDQKEGMGAFLAKRKANFE